MFHLNLFVKKKIAQNWVLLLLLGSTAVNLLTVECHSTGGAIRTQEAVNCTGEGFLQCVEELTHYVNTKKVPNTNESDINLVVGLTRVGKSIITQIIANDSNLLPVYCLTPSQCAIMDDSGFSSNMGTFLPNLIVHNSTQGVQSAFYDMPGFKDNRNVTIDIATTYFLRTVVKKAQRLRVVVVGLHSYFHFADALGFRLLLTSLCNLFKDASKFSQSVAFISNYVPRGYYEDELYYQYLRYIQEFNPAAIEETCRPFASEFMSFLNTSTRPDMYDVPTYIRPFNEITRDHNGTDIRTNPALQTAIKDIQHLVWNATQYVPVSITDFKFPLRFESGLFLEKVVLEFSNITDLIDGAKENAIFFLTDLYSGVANSSTDASQLIILMNNMMSTSYEFATDPTTTMISCLNQTMLAVEKFAPGSFPEGVLEEFVDVLNLMDLIHEITNGDAVRCMDWVSPFLHFKEDLIQEVSSKGVHTRIFDESLRDLIVGSQAIFVILMDLVRSHPNPQAELNRIINASEEAHANLMSIAEAPITTASLLFSAYEVAYLNLSENRSQMQLDSMKVHFLELIGDGFDWRHRDWLFPFQLFVIQPLKAEAGITFVFVQ